MDVRGGASGGYYLIPPPFELATDRPMVTLGCRMCIIVNVSDRGGRAVTSIWMNARNRGNYHNFGQTFDIYFNLTRSFC